MSYCILDKASREKGFWKWWETHTLENYDPTRTDLLCFAFFDYTDSKEENAGHFVEPLPVDEIFFLIIYISFIQKCSQLVQLLETY